jgi:hypothetical protein
MKALWKFFVASCSSVSPLQAAAWTSDRAVLKKN